MKQVIFLILVFLLVACSPETQEVNPTRESVIRAEVTPDVVIDVDTSSVSLASIDIVEDTFTDSATYGNATFGEGIFDAKCNACLILPDSIVSSDSDISDVYAKAIYYANGEISPEGYLVTSMQDNEWTSLSENEIYHVIAYFKSAYDAEVESVDVAILETPEPEVIVEATEEVVAEDDTTTDDDAVASDDPFVLGAANADPALGEQLFTGNFVMACNTCHFVDSEAMLVGPGLLTVGDHAESRIDGVSAEEYLYNSIVHPNDFIVDGFAPAMPAVYETGLSQDEVYALVAYLMTFGAEEATTEEDTTTDDSATETEDDAVASDNVFVLAVANADPVAGEQLFTGNFITPCNTCHFVDSDAMLIGPGLLNVGDHADSRIEGVPAEEYLYNSIAHPNDFIVDGFAPAMPAVYETGMTEEEIYNLVAYLMTLGAEEATTEEATTEEDTTADDSATETDDETTEENTTADDSASETEDDAVASDNPFVLGVASADPVAGQQLFVGNFITPCNSCHFTDSEAMLVGPGLLNVRDHAESRIEGVPVEEYLYNSIIHPNDFIVDGYTPSMPTTYEMGMTEEEVYNLIAYLMTLGE